ncbi:hypothetical protein [Vibrio aestuarianus]|uniref:hypothetical protein n=1 Tax=Vibrio aestuarianus TaxID=28171 RepID=UPI0021C4C8A3|nr:hypothetical protein [Vibrio aestuarianus]
MHTETHHLSVTFSALFGRANGQVYTISKSYKLHATVSISKPYANNQRSIVGAAPNKLLKWTLKRSAFLAWSLVCLGNSVAAPLSKALGGLLH